jgi:hypothetical protein
MSETQKPNQINPDGITWHITSPTPEPTSEPASEPTSEPASTNQPSKTAKSTRFKGK